ncbi:MAG: malate dehydrogenase (quinone) [Microbacteriaceae bacterium]|nr:malate dehydrogenase (quinone) [Microbacteriaceae bacterium]
MDVVLIGAGIMSATLASFLRELEPSWSFQIIERQPDAAMESSNAWNNAGTGHSALCELNYSPQQEDGSITITNAVKVNEQFQVSRQFWAWLTKQKIVKDPSTFIRTTPHMSFVWGEKDVEFLRKRYAALKDHPLFAGMEYSEDLAQIAKWAPLIAIGRKKDQAVAATYALAGTDVNFGSLTRQLIASLEAKGVEVKYETTVTDIKRKKNGKWVVTSSGVNGKKNVVTAKYVFVGAGGGALSLLQSSGIKEIQGFGAFPVSGQFFKTTNPELVQRHNTKVYGKAQVGAPPMSVPHLDSRTVDGEGALLFGPYAGFTPKFLKYGSRYELLGSLRFRNLLPDLHVGLKTLGDGLMTYLISQVFASKKKKFESLLDFMPTADPRDWELITAGQRVQVIRPEGGAKGILQFGTEVITSEDGTMSGLLGASPGASTAAPIMIDVLKRCYPQRYEEWLPKLKQMVPSIGQALSDKPALAKKTLESTAKALKLEA